VSTGEFDDEMIFFVRKLDSSEGINWKKTGYRCKQIESIRIDIAVRLIAMPSRVRLRGSNSRNSGPAISIRPLASGDELEEGSKMEGKRKLRA
jgi:hypothetical protein